MEKTTAWVFLTLLFGLSLSFWLLPDQAFSEQENRGLAPLPRFSVERLLSGELSRQVDDYFADQFPNREGLVGLKGVCELALGKGEDNGILLGENGRLARVRFSLHLPSGNATDPLDTFDEAAVEKACQGIGRANRGTPRFSVMLTGRNLDVYAKSFSYPTQGSERLLSCVEGHLNALGVTSIDTVRLLRERAEDGEEVYYRTDHHWTTRGAYYAYQAFMREMGREDEILDERVFEKEQGSDAFFGTLWSASGMRWVMPDRVELWTLGDEDDYRVVADGVELEGFYTRRHLQEKDCYRVFLDGTHDVVTVTKRDGAERERLLLIKDSFANSLAPFLARHYDLILCNLSSTRTDFTDVQALAARYEADRTLLVYTLENLLTADRLERLH